MVGDIFLLTVMGVLLLLQVVGTKDFLILYLIKQNLSNREFAYLMLVFLSKLCHVLLVTEN